jgi:hypothetical protein
MFNQATPFALLANELIFLHTCKPCGTATIFSMRCCHEKWSGGPAWTAYDVEERRLEERTQDLSNTMEYEQIGRMVLLNQFKYRVLTHNVRRLQTYVF